MHPACLAVRLVFVTILLVVPQTVRSATQDSTGASESNNVPISECAINGFGLGDTQDKMRERFGEPGLKPSAPNTPSVFLYDGLRIEFSTSGRSAMGFFVSSPAYRLESGIGVGSTWAEVIAVYGPGRLLAWGDRNTYFYRIVGLDGERLPATLTFRIVDEVVAEFFVTTTH